MLRLTLLRTKDLEDSVEDMTVRRRGVMRGGVAGVYRSGRWCISTRGVDLTMPADEGHISPKVLLLTVEMCS